jgi:hypothetical protein
VDREAVAREVRRRQVTESLEFEREREKTIGEQIDLVIAEIEGPKVDASVFERMSAEDVALMKEELSLPESERGDEFFERDDVIWLDEPPDQRAEELARLNEELDDCRRRQRAFESYLAALGS